jgi:hypothetical protein
VRLYFYKQEKLAMHVGTTFTFYDDVARNGDSTLNFAAGGNGGLTYFLTPNIGIGPILEVTHYFLPSGDFNATEFRFAGEFSLFL